MTGRPPEAGTRRRAGDRGGRAQSHVVGVALLLGVAVISMGALTAAVGTVVEENAAGADAARVADELDAALEPVEVTGPNRGRVAFARGRLRTVERDLRVLDGDGVAREVSVGAVVFEAGDRRVTYLTGAVVRGGSGRARMVEPPPITASRGEGGVLVVGAARVGSLPSVGGSEVRVTLATNVTHDRERLGDGEYRVAVETATPAAWERYFEDRGATVTRRDLDGDGTESVVAAFPGERTAHLVVHDLNAEVRRG